MKAYECKECGAHFSDHSELSPRHKSVIKCPRCHSNRVHPEPTKVRPQAKKACGA